LTATSTNWALLATSLPHKRLRPGGAPGSWCPWRHRE
jgi:hypothetical protein